MLLAVDIGNTNMAIGLFDRERLVHSWRLSSRRDFTSDELTVLLRGLLAVEHSRVGGAIVASVVPPLTATLVQALRAICPVEPLEVAPGIKTGIKIRTDNPAEVGADRIVNSVAAFARHGGPAIIVDFGTATTLDVITADGDYLGGVICPGPMLGIDALSARTARLPRIDLSAPPRVIGRNTVDSMRSGIVHGHAAMVQGLITAIDREASVVHKKIATGGFAMLMRSLLPEIEVFEPDLTLEGLRLVYERNVGR